MNGKELRSWDQDLSIHVYMEESKGNEMGYVGYAECRVDEERS